MPMKLSHPVLVKGLTGGVVKGGGRGWEEDEWGAPGFSDLITKVFAY